VSGHEDDEPPRLERPSKSELKRRAQAQHQLVEDLGELSEGMLRKIDLTAATLADLAQIRQMKPSQARNRAIKHLASRLLDSEREAADAFLNDRKTLQAEETRHFHQLERWRDRLIEEGDAALGELCAAHPQLDRQQLRTLMRSAQKDRQSGKSSGAARKLFQQIREIFT
jgi:ribosome-associated protein